MDKHTDKWTVGQYFTIVSLENLHSQGIITMSNSQYCPTLSGEQTYRQMEMDRQTDRQTR